MSLIFIEFYGLFLAHFVTDFVTIGSKIETLK